MSSKAGPVAAHNQLFSNRYIVGYHEHGPREGDPHAADFRAWKKRQKVEGKYRCAWAVRVGDDSECDLTAPLEAHHGHLELALLNNVNWDHLEKVFPGISDPDKAGAWIDSDQNLMLLCQKHHRGVAHGVHHLDWAMYESSYFLAAGTLLDAPKQGLDKPAAG